MKLISIVVPCYNEEEVLPLFYAEITKVMAQIKEKHSDTEFELLFINDGSKDGTLREFRKLAAMDERVRYISFSRNFGKEAGMYAGLQNSKGDYVVLMDVEMPGMTGIECARYIQDKNPRTAIIFATAHEEYMKSAFEVYAFDYLVKPFKAERALNTLALIRERRFGNPETQPAAAPKVRPAAKKLMLRHKEGMSFLDLTDILLIQREERSTVIYTVSGEKFITADSLSELDERLPDDMFFRTHKSYIVNLAHIESISPYGRWTYVIKLAGTRLDALITHERYAELQQMYE